MSKIKILGIGSYFGQDDIGWKAADILANHLNQYPKLKQQVILEKHDRPGLRLIELMQESKAVFILDAVCSGQPVGTLHCLENDAIFCLKNTLSTHDFGIAHALELALALHQLPPFVMLYGFEIDPKQNHSSENILKELTDNWCLRLVNKASKLTRL